MAVNLAKMRNLGVEELRKEEAGLREEIWRLRLQMTTGQLQDPHRVLSTRRDLARILTIIREQELAAGRKS